MKTTKNIILVLFLLSFSSIFAQNLHLIKEKNIKTQFGKTLEIDAKIADLVIKGTNSEEAEIKIYGNKKAEKECDFYISETGNGIKIKVEKDGWNFFNVFNNINVKIEVRLPEKYNLELKTSGGDISIYSITGDSEVKTSGGDITLNQTNGKLRGTTSGGDIKLDKHNGNVKLSTSGGDIEVTHLNGYISASTSGGDVQITSQNGGINASTSGGDIRVAYSGKNMGIKLDTSGGDITVKVDKTTQANVYLSSSGGDTELNFSKADYIKNKSHTIKATINGGGEEIDCRTSGGDVTLSER